jgi:superfamily I DNA and/or RNA helicase
MSFTIIIQNNATSEMVNLEIKDHELLALKNDLMGDSGIIDWIVNAIKGKIFNCNKRMRTEWTNKLLEAEILPPKDDIAFISMVTSMNKYEDRQLREIKAMKSVDIIKN